MHPFPGEQLKTSWESRQGAETRELAEAADEEERRRAKPPCQGPVHPHWRANIEPLCHPRSSPSGQSIAGIGEEKNSPANPVALDPSKTISVKTVQSSPHPSLAPLLSRGLLLPELNLPPPIFRLLKTNPLHPTKVFP